MKPRERVLKAFRRLDGLPDRVPIQFDLCSQHLEHFGAKLGIPVNYTHNLYEDITCRISANEIRTVMGRDGGYMISPAHIIQADVAPERVEKFVELCLKHGRY